MKKADYIFETSWEICHKVGGIYTVLSTKAQTIVNEYKNNYLCIGPDLLNETSQNPDFIEDASLYQRWREIALREGLRIRIGRWNIVGKPIAILVDFTPFFEKKNEILTDFWLKYKLDSISGQWDYIEPLLFGYAAGKVIESFYRYYCNALDHIVAQFHEWMTGSGILYLAQCTPQIATVFTTHATVLGRCIAGNGLPLYDKIHSYSPAETAAQFEVQSKFSLENLSAQVADAFTTVSPITDLECRAFFGKPADVITINGFELDFVPPHDSYPLKRAAARAKLRQVATTLLQQPISDNAFWVLTSGRYEFTNKGIDVFIRSLSLLYQENPDREIVAVVAVPAGVNGARHDLLQKMNDSVASEATPTLRDYATHLLQNPHNDPIINALNRYNLDNAPSNNVKVLFVPVYLNGNDGLLNLNYYDTLIGFDLTVFASYYEPWGYTPLESIAFGVPTITTSLSGFGGWINDHFSEPRGVSVIPRTDNNNTDVCQQIVRAIQHYATLSDTDYAAAAADAANIATNALWKNLFQNYRIAYDKALKKSELRNELYQDKMAQIHLIANHTRPTTQPNWKQITIKSNLPANLAKLEELANNLWWSWNYAARDLFIEITGKERWQQFDENPVHLLQMLPLDLLQSFSKNSTFIQKLEHVYADFKQYMETPSPRKEKKVAYFSMEFGISNELKIYSGGLGMLAGDYLKEASDCHVNMVAVGLLYRCGYFVQQISPNGEQINLYPQQSFSKLPIHPVRDEQGNWRTIAIGLAGRQLYARIWRVDVGRIKLYLLDTDVDTNSPSDRTITANLYGGDWENRLKQELLLGIGGVRLLKLLGENAEIFHLNEGHAAFLSLERTHDLITEKHVSFSIAMELVRASSLFTTHTPVPAGHDAFSEELMRTYFAHYPEKVGISWETFMGLGRKCATNPIEKFSMSLLACRCCQEVNGVSRIHGRVTREMFEYLYDGRFAEELHIGYVTNGVHYPTWAHKKWQQFHNQVFGNNYKQNISDKAVWNKIYQADDAAIWNLKEELRKELIANVKELVEIQMRRRNESPERIVQTIKAIRDDVLTVGFARRFATYKRAHLLFTNEDKLKALLHDPARPMQFIFAGKAHPHDKAGQDLIRRIIEFSRRPEFIGKIIFVENYDMILAKKLISGCDVWLNTPTRPLEASGTSGEKAIMNGVLNFSVLDGWWAEGYVPNAGWAVDEHITYTDHQRQDELDIANLFYIFEEQIKPTFYNRTAQIPLNWVQMMKNNFAQIAPRFTMKRQLDDYYHLFYNKLSARIDLLTNDNNANLYQLVQWKNHLITCWDNIAFVGSNLPTETDSTLLLGDLQQLMVQVKLGNLSPEDVQIELLFTKQNGERMELFSRYVFLPQETVGDTTTFVCAFDAKVAGVWNYAIRMIPSHPLLAHNMELNLVKWE